MPLPNRTITEVIRYCNRDLVPDVNFDSTSQYHSDWCCDYFSFLQNPAVEKHLGDAFYQARFMYKMMSALRLPVSKHRGIVKFQIIQYASICEAVLDTAITKYFADDVANALAVTEWVKYPNATTRNTKITHEGNNLVLCKEKKRPGVLKRTRVDFKTKYAVGKGIIAQPMKDAVDELYDLRNNIHILKAADSQYNPLLREAKDAFNLMQSFVEEVKSYYAQNPTTA